MELFSYNYMYGWLWLMIFCLVVNVICIFLCDIVSYSGMRRMREQKLDHQIANDIFVSFSIYLLFFFLTYTAFIFSNVHVSSIRVYKSVCAPVDRSFIIIPIQYINFQISYGAVVVVVFTFYCFYCKSKSIIILTFK